MSNKVLATDINSLFMKLEELRKEHLNSTTGQSSAATTALSTPFNTNATTIEDTISSNPYTLMNEYLLLLRNSKYLIDNITEEQIENLLIPEVGTLITATELNEREDFISTLEEMPSSFSSNFFTTNFSTFRSASSVFGSNFSSFRSSSSVFGSSFTFGTFFSSFSTVRDHGPSCFGFYKISANY